MDLGSKAYPCDAKVRIDELAIKMYEMALGMIRRQVAGTFVFSRKSILQMYHNPKVEIPAPRPYSAH
jgi:hypothetical protein